MGIVGICRFSFLGWGDWKATLKKPMAEIEAMAAERADQLFADARMESRFETFEHLTLASLKGQTDQDFTFLVLASSLMPENHRARLDALCAQVPQVVVRYFPVTTVPAAQKSAFKELGIRFADVLQFRLDDDDCVCADYIEVMRRYASPLTVASKTFVASLRGVMLCAVTGPRSGVYNWPIAYYGVGAAMRNPRASIFEYGHFKMARGFLSLTIPRGMALVTQDFTNDTSLPTKGQLRRNELTRMTPAEIAATQERFFPFLTGTGKRIAGLTVAVEDAG